MNLILMESFKKMFREFNKFRESSFHKMRSFFHLPTNDPSVTDSDEIESLDSLRTEYIDGYYYDEDVYYDNGRRIPTTTNLLKKQRVRIL